MNSEKGFKETAPQELSEEEKEKQAEEEREKQDRIEDATFFANAELPEEEKEEPKQEKTEEEFKKEVVVETAEEAENIIRGFWDKKLALEQEPETDSIRTAKETLIDGLKTMTDEQKIEKAKKLEARLIKIREVEKRKREAVEGGEDMFK